MTSASSAREECVEGTPEVTFEAALRQELDRRIETISSLSDDAFGRIGSAEWVLFVLATIGIPLGLVWWFA